MSAVRLDYKLKILIEANPVDLETRFGEWVHEEVGRIHGEPQLQFTQALQKFILMIVYSEREKDDVTTNTGELVQTF